MSSYKALKDEEKELSLRRQKLRAEEEWLKNHSGAIEKSIKQGTAQWEALLKNKKAILQKYSDIEAAASKSTEETAATFEAIAQALRKSAKFEKDVMEKHLSNYHLLLQREKKHRDKAGWDDTDGRLPRMESVVQKIESQ